MNSVKVIGILFTLSLAAVSVAQPWSQIAEAPKKTEFGQRYIFETPDAGPVEVEWLHVQGQSGPFVVQAQPLGPEQQQLFSQLRSQHKELFLNKRKTLLMRIARVLSSTKTVWGVGSAAKDGALLHLFRRRPQTRPMESFVRFAEDAGLIANVEAKNKSHRVIQDLLNVLDRELWMHAPLISEANEFGLTLFFDLGAGALVWDRGLYGSAGLGFTFSYNHTAESFVFEFFQDAQVGKRGLPVVAQVAGCAKCLLSVAANPASLMQSGRAVYPPGPIAVLDTPKSLQMGFSQGIGFPPLDTFYAMESKLYRWTLLRVEVGSQKAPFKVDSVLWRSIERLTKFCSQALGRFFNRT